jgi:malonyl-CoA decarboxylase
MNGAFFGDLLQTISDRGKKLLSRRTNAVTRSADFVVLCEDLLSGRGEASGVALAREILTRYSELTIGPRIAFFEALAQQFGPDRARVEKAIADWQSNPSDATASELHQAAEPRRQELFRRLNLAPGGTASLVRMREQLLDAMAHRPDLSVVDADFVHLFSSWFNRGFLVLRDIDWSTPANILEKIIKHEAVHKIRSWDDLRRRIDPEDRCCYAFFHPALNDEPLIFVEVALTSGIPGAIEPILAADREALDANEVDTAVFYSISNCQRGLAGVSFGNFLIKQVVEEVSRDNSRLKTFVTLSPVPGFASWLRRERQSGATRALTQEDLDVLANLDTEGWWQLDATREQLEEPLKRAAAWYFLHAKNGRGFPADPVARFHLGNGARLEKIHFLADTSDNGLRQSYGVMVNYLYDLDDIEKNHEAFAENRAVVTSSAVRKLARPGPTGDLIPLSNKA